MHSRLRSILIGWEIENNAISSELGEKSRGERETIRAVPVEREREDSCGLRRFRKRYALSMFRSFSGRISGLARLCSSNLVGISEFRENSAVELNSFRIPVAFWLDRLVAIWKESESD